MFHNPSAKTWTPTLPPSNTSISLFHRTLPSYSITPLIPLPSLAKDLDLGHILLKDESSRLGLPAFKILGASWAIHKAVAASCKLPLTSTLEELGAAARKEGARLVTCTEGNWGRAVARMARYLQIPAVVFVPEFMDEATRRRISSEGASVVVVDGDYDVSIQKAREEAEGGGLLVMDVSFPGYEIIPEWVVEGYSTMLSETDQQLHDLGIENVTHAIASVGVGSWAQAVTLHYKSKSPPTKIVAVEPDTAASLKASLEAGRITPITTGHTIMNGMNCGTTSTTAWEVLRRGVDVSVTVSDMEVHRDLQYLHSQGIKNGPCGAAPLSALRKLCAEAKEKLGLDEQSVVVLFSTEGAREYIIPTET
ncbi:tryptophan synthase beta subunit-like PLP-dependent enzyme [Dothidotthia symphoricarpi CBS 119687]|uniref:Tryptophan synthase beta subunit-like PLP-dependent enzyme n=1 Tax=Dothidotthia symphoricarpi CBS 119687 TaxID=1392245 RepID=A0A6A6ARD7_9PLEO|nr:tryptophan synthase beta subunit-like PLP-dependent enzyme [Dothidotthia symphoricarpi CBS 119687]KAF2134552.1 tryptophan synthase beta subunit-like PLP-dependent enzyme [Dothidotthia symphoricarpi CBS 119687]